MNKPQSFRTSERRHLGVMVKSRVRSRPVYIDMVDISEGGCKIKGSAGFADIGDRITMKVGSINAPLGKVVWIDGRFAGVAFEGEMHPAMLDYLCALNDGTLEVDAPRLYRL